MPETPPAIKADSSDNNYLGESKQLAAKSVTFGAFLMFQVLHHMNKSSKTVSKKNTSKNFMVDGYPRQSMYD